MTIPVFISPSLSKALFTGVLLSYYALVLTFGGTAPGYTPFHPRTISGPRYGTISDRVPINDTEFEQRMKMHAGGGEFAMSLSQEAELIRRYKRRTHDLSNNEYLRFLRADSSMSEKQILCALTEYTYRNNATLFPLRTLSQREVEELMAAKLDQTNARLIFESALQAQRSGATEIAKSRFKFLIDNAYIREREPAMSIVANNEFNVIQ